MFPFFGNFAYGESGSLALGITHLNLTDFVYPDHDHYEAYEWFYNATYINEESGRPGNLPEADWNFFINHDDYFALVRTELEYHDWVQHGNAQVSRPQRFHYEYIGNHMFHEYLERLGLLVVQQNTVMIILKKWVMMLMKYIKKKKCSSQKKF